MMAQSKVGASKNITSEISKNLDKYYGRLSTLKPQQLATLKLMDSLDRQGRREAYKDLMAAYGQNSDFAVAVAAYNWNVVMPILVSYRKDLDRYITPADKAAIHEIRSKMIAKYNFITSIRDHDSSPETEAIVATVQEEILTDIQESILPSLLVKYDDRIVDVRINLGKHEKQIKADIQNIYDEYMIDNYKNQIVAENEFLNMLGISKLLKDSFLLLMDGDSRAASFKINALHLMAHGLAITDQF
jgi:oligoendopeptidase F